MKVKKRKCVDCGQWTTTNAIRCPKCLEKRLNELNQNSKHDNKERK